MSCLESITLQSIIIACVFIIQTNGQSFGSPFGSPGILGRGTPDSPFTFEANGNSNFGRPLGVGNNGLPPPNFGFGSTAGGFGLPNPFSNPIRFGGTTTGFPNSPFINGPQIPFADVPQLPNFGNGNPTTISTGTGNGLQTPFANGQQTTTFNTGPQGSGSITPPIPPGTLAATENSVTSRFTNNAFSTIPQPNTGVNMNPGNNIGVNMNPGNPDVNMNQGVRPNVNMNPGVNFNQGNGVNINPGVNFNQGNGVNMNPGVNFNQGTGVNMNPGVNFNPGPNVLFNRPNQPTALPPLPTNNQPTAMLPLPINNQIPVGVPTGSTGFSPVSPGVQNVNMQNSQLVPNANLLRPGIRPDNRPDGCQIHGCKSGEQCTFDGRFVCPEWIPTLPCRCNDGCRVMNTYIPKNTAMRIDTCGNTCTCLREDGVAACTVLDCKEANQGQTPPEIAPSSNSLPQNPTSVSSPTDAQINPV